MEWTRERTLSLINEYRKRRGLWDMTHDDYRKKDVKQNLLVEVSSSLGGSIPIVEIEKKFHTLRTQYHREINRMKRKEPYNSKWFGFKNLQFLSSPKACRSGKGRIKAEITEEGTVTTKYIKDSQLDSSGGSNANGNEEFVSIYRKPTISYEAGTTVSSRSHELEKLIEETTKDVEDGEEAKPKMNIKGLEHHNYNAQLHSSALEMSGDDQDPLQQDGHESHHQTQVMDDDEEPIETIDIQQSDEDMAYQSNSSVGGGGSTGAHNQSTTIHHHSTIPTRIIKIQRRNTCQDDEYYDDNQEHAPQIQTMSSSAAKRIFYEANGQQHTATILAPTSTVTQPSSTILNPTAKLHQFQSRNNISLTAQPLAQQRMRDEFATFGEYVGNEMRGIGNREILVALKHKINTALFEAHTADMHK